MTTLTCRILTIISLVGLLAACAPPASTPTSGNLTREMRQVHSSLNRQEQAMQKLSSQVTELEKRLQRQSDELQQLRQAPQQGLSGYQPSQIPQMTTASIQEEGSPTEVYLQAFGDYASGRYQTAINGFESFLQRFPNNSYASNAQFWLGDCYFNQQQYPLAVQEFERVLSDYQSAQKSPDALLKIAIAQLQLGATDQARQAIDILNRQYPKSTATQKAQELAIPE